MLLFYLIFAFPPIQPFEFQRMIALEEPLGASFSTRKNVFQFAKIAVEGRSRPNEQTRHECCNPICYRLQGYTYLGSFSSFFFGCLLKSFLFFLPFFFFFLQSFLFDLFLKFFLFFFFKSLLFSFLLCLLTSPFFFLLLLSLFFSFSSLL